jgi:NitT/TauT family transport system substrate-binding protein
MVFLNWMDKNGGDSKTLKPVMVGSVIAEDSVPCWYAIQSGMFRKAGLDVNFQKVSNGSASATGIATGTFNVGNTNVMAAINAHVHNVPLTIIGSSGLYIGQPHFQGVISLKDAPFKTAADLNGKILGTTSVKDINSMVFLNWMDKNGGDSKTLKVVEVPYSAVLPALEQGRIDVGTILQPFMNQAVASGKARIFCDNYTSVGRCVTSSFVANVPWADANPETVRTFVRVLREAQVWANSHHDETAKIMSEQSGVDVAAITSGGREDFDPGFAEPRDFQPIVDVAVKYGALDKRIDAADLLCPAVRSLRA